MKLAEVIFDKIARSGSPEIQLHLFAENSVLEGLSKEEILNLFVSLRQIAIDRKEEELEDAILDVMDRITGWCAPNQRLF